MKEQRERSVLKMTFTSDSQIFAELDKIAGTTRSSSYSRATVLRFLKSKRWIIEELEDIADTESGSQDPQAVGSQDPLSVSAMPLFSMTFAQSPSLDEDTHATNSFRQVAAPTAESNQLPDESCSSQQPASTQDDNDDTEEDDPETSENDDPDEAPSKPANRSAYAGRGNLKWVRAARKNAGLSDAFPRSDPLLKKYANYLIASEASPLDAHNKVAQMAKMLKYVSTYKSTDAPDTATPEMMTKVSALTRYIKRLRGKKIQLKASAMKNELNAAISFIKFLRLSYPQLKQSLEGASDLISHIKSGTLKKINEDRNRKTTANIQNGLPFTLADVRSQTEDPKLLERVSIR